MRHRINVLAFVCTAALSVSAASGALVLSQSEGLAPVVYDNGGGGGFGGTLGSGAISMDVVGTNLVISFAPGNVINDIVGLYLDTRSGGFIDADMRDHADGTRTYLSELTLTKNDDFPAGVLPDFAVGISNFGSLLFELNSGNTDGHLNFVSFNPAPNITIPLATLGNPTTINFFAGYGSGGGYNSNESLPAGAINSSGNPGFGDGQFGGLNTGGTYDNYNQFTIPEPASLGLLAIGGTIMLRRRR